MKSIGPPCPQTSLMSGEYRHRPPADRGPGAGGRPGSAQRVEAVSRTTGHRPRRLCTGVYSARKRTAPECARLKQAKRLAPLWGSSRLAQAPRRASTPSLSGYPGLHSITGVEPTHRNSPVYLMSDGFLPHFRARPCGPSARQDHDPLGRDAAGWVHDRLRQRFSASAWTGSIGRYKRSAQPVGRQFGLSQ